ncbi:MAG: L7Ae/L30e/S12e/Gadd45 family ribosomal protein [Oscillospiraceae bacterium]|jgi:ribosomal protein L7Ae-like RNA K-turn-binding protein|nr:L7Ae/L30e/S12e/Gadd45 family ribosomal protein [Oscillospiraceae bacterium]
MTNDILSLLGLARKARRLEAGEEPVSAALLAGKATLCMAASDSSENTKRRTAQWAESAGVKFIELDFTKEELGGAIGRGLCAVAVLTDRGFTDSLLRKLSSQ